MVTRFGVSVVFVVRSFLSHILVSLGPVSRLAVLGRARALLIVLCLLFPFSFAHPSISRFRVAVVALVSFLLNRVRTSILQICLVYVHV